MSSSGFNTLELAIFDSIKRTYPFDEIRAQIDAAKLKDRDFTGVGFFVDINVSLELQPIDLIKLTNETTITGPSIKTEILEYGAWCHVFLTDGYLSCLEIYTLGSENFPEAMNSFEIEDIGPFKPMHWSKRILLDLYRLIIPQKKAITRKYTIN